VSFAEIFLPSNALINAGESFSSFFSEFFNIRSF
jgi:hypothetical protein